MTFDKWVPYRTETSAVRCRIFCFPHAGGTAAFYRTWRPLMPAGVDLCPVELPGRGARIEEHPFTRVGVLVNTLCKVLQPLLNVPFALFGHSMGACLAFETARHLRSSDGRTAAHVFVSARPAPLRAISDPPLASLPDPLLLATLSRFGGVPAAVMARSELMDAILPIIRADLALVENYRADIAGRCAVSMTAFGGDQDDSVDVHALQSWRGLTSGAFRIRVFHGGHFYFSTAPTALIQEIVADLGRSGALSAA